MLTINFHITFIHIFTLHFLTQIDSSTYIDDIMKILFRQISIFFGWTTSDKSFFFVDFAWILCKSKCFCFYILAFLCVSLIFKNEITNQGENMIFRARNLIKVSYWDIIKTIGNKIFICYNSNFWVLWKCISKKRTSHRRKLK